MRERDATRSVLVTCCCFHLRATAQGHTNVPLANRRWNFCASCVDLSFQGHRSSQAVRSTSQSVTTTQELLVPGDTALVRSSCDLLMYLMLMCRVVKCIQPHPQITTVARTTGGQARVIGMSKINKNVANCKRGYRSSLLYRRTPYVRAEVFRKNTLCVSGVPADC
jgi:hypothetical protein